MKDIYQEAEDQIIEKQKIVDFDIKEFTIEILVSKYLNGLENDENDIFIPEYQRNFVWAVERQSKFIESVLLGLPIPYIFTADVKDGRLEVVDGSQRLRTLVSFLNNDLTLKSLELLPKLNGFSYSSLNKGRQRKFLNSTMRMITLSDKSDEDVRFLLFERINTGSDLLRDMEKRKGIYGGKFVDFVYKECSNHPLFKKLTVFTDKLEKRGEPQELIIRFFAFSERYKNVKAGINDFLNEFTKDKNRAFDKKLMYFEFDRMLKFVDKYFPNGFKRAAQSLKTPRLRFDSIAVGVNLALRENANLKPKNVHWLDSDNYTYLLTHGGQNAPSLIIARIDYVKENLL